MTGLNALIPIRDNIVGHMTGKLRVHVVMKNGKVLDFTMHKDAVARLMEELTLDGEAVESVRIVGRDGEPFSEN